MKIKLKKQLQLHIRNAYPAMITITTLQKILSEINKSRFELEGKEYKQSNAERILRPSEKRSDQKNT